MFAKGKRTESGNKNDGFNSYLVMIKKMVFGILDSGLFLTWEQRGGGYFFLGLAFFPVVFECFLDNRRDAFA